MTHEMGSESEGDGASHPGSSSGSLVWYPPEKQPTPRRVNNGKIHEDEDEANSNDQGETFEALLKNNNGDRIAGKEPDGTIHIESNV